jgi:hypothetical protein
MQKVYTKRHSAVIDMNSSLILKLVFIALALSNAVEAAYNCSCFIANQTLEVEYK